MFLDYKSGFELIESTLIGDIEQKKTKNTFNNIDDFETYINAIDDGYDSEDSISTGWLYKLNTP